jgi:hypothetical protein
MSESNYIALTAEIVSAYVSNNPVPAADMPGLINQVHSALTRISGGQADVQPEPLKPAVSVKKSITPDYIVCLEDGKKFKSLKRHLRDPRAIPRQVGFAAGLSHGGAELRGRALATRQADGTGSAAPPPRPLMRRGLAHRATVARGCTE